MIDPGILTFCAVAVATVLYALTAEHLLKRALRAGKNVSGPDGAWDAAGPAHHQGYQSGERPTE